MRKLPFAAKLYLCATYVAAAVAAWLLATYYAGGPVTAGDWLLALGLATVGAVTQLNMVDRRGTERNDNLTPAPLFAVPLLLPPPLVACVILAIFTAEWIWLRRKWYAQLFNAASYIIPSALVLPVLHAFTGSFRLASTLPHAALAVTLMVPLYLGMQLMLMYCLMYLLHGKPDRSILAPDLIFFETSLMCLGVGFAVSWLTHPIFGLASLLPLALFGRALHVPNLKEEAATDPKTGLANMRSFNDQFPKLLERARRTTTPLSVLMCDLDYLRSINNGYGHQAGDTVLQGVAHIIRTSVRDQDVAARFGGEEFVIVLPSADSADALAVAERVRKRLEEHEFHIGHADGPIRATLSAGIATLPNHATTGPELLREADLAAYLAKDLGRNRVCIACEESRRLKGAWQRKQHALAAESAAARQLPNRGERFSQLWHRIRGKGSA